MKQPTYTVLMRDNETGKTKEIFSSDVVILAAIEENSEHVITVDARLYRSGETITPQDVIDVASTLPDFVEKIVENL